MGRSGRLVVDGEARILKADAGAAAIAQTTPEMLIGLTAIDIAAPADRDAAWAALARVRDTGGESQAMRRIVVSDGSHLWITSHLSPLPDRKPPAFLVEIEEAAAPDGWVEPARLLRFARLVRDARIAGRRAFGPLIVVDHAWDILFAAYIAEAEGTLLQVAAVAVMTEGDGRTVRRWLRALQGEGMIELEDGAEDPGSALVRLSSESHRRFEAFLSAMARDWD